MRLLSLLGILLTALDAGAQTPASKLWTDLKAKRETLPGLHQEFDVSRTFKTANGNQSVKREIVLDMSPGPWREKSASGSGNSIRIFDGTDLLQMEEGGNEFVRIKHRPKEEDPMPSPYSSGDPDWSKAVELERVIKVSLPFGSCSRRRDWKSNRTELGPLVSIRTRSRCY